MKYKYLSRCAVGLIAILIALGSFFMSEEAKEDRNCKIINEKVCKIFCDPDVKHCDIFYDYSWFIKKPIKLSIYLYIDRDLDLGQARQLIVEYYLKFFESINKEEFAKYLSYFPLNLDHISFHIKFFNNNALFPRSYPSVSEIFTQNGGLEYLKLLGMSKEFFTPSFKESFFEAYEITKNQISPNLQEIAENLPKCDVKLSDMALERKSFLEKYHPKDLNWQS